MIRFFNNRTILLTLIAVFLLAVLIPRIKYFIEHRDPEIVTDFSIGLKPYSDAYAWYQGSYSIREGRVLSDVASRRPLYPLFLSALSFVFDDNYSSILFAQIILYTTAALFAVYILAHYSAVVTLIFGLYLVLLGIDLPSLFVTENLGLLLAIPGILLTVYAISNMNTLLLASSFFFLGLSQQARPLAIVTILTIPFLVCFSEKRVREKSRSVVMLVAATILAPLLLLFYIKLNFNPEPSDSYSPVLYGLAHGGIGWMSFEKDAEVIRARASGKTEPEVHRIARKLAVNKLVNEPKLFLKSIYPSYKASWKNIRSLFSNKGAIIKNFYIVTLILGLVYIFVERHNRISLFLILYYLGLAISVPLVGTDGGLRAHAASFPVYMLTSALGVKWMLEKARIKDTRLTPALRTGTVKIMALAFLSFIIMFLMIIPTLVFYKAKSTESSNGPKYTYNLTISSDYPEAIKEQEIWKELDRWPNADFIRFNGKDLFVELIFYKNRFNYLTKDQGLSEAIPGYRMYYWPMSKKAYSRYIGWTNLRSNHTIWLEIPKKVIRGHVDLLNGRRIAVQGKIVSKNIDWKYDTFMSLLSKEIYYEENGVLRSLKED